MTITLVKSSSVAKILYHGHSCEVIPPGKTLKIETSPYGVDILDVDVPEGEEWIANIDVSVIAREPS